MTDIEKILYPSTQPKYRPKNLDQAIGKVVEEMGEANAAIGKSLRWGLDSYNPDLALLDRETNVDWVLRELQDVREAIDGLVHFLTPHTHKQADLFDGDEP